MSTNDDSTSQIIKYQTFPDSRTIDAYYDEKEQKDYEACRNNKSLISEGFFRNLDGKDRKTKTIILSKRYRVAENTIKEYRLNTSDSDQNIPALKTKLKHIQDLIESEECGAVYNSRGACRVFSACCVWFNIYEIIHNGVSVIWTSLIHDKILQSDQARVNSWFYNAISQLFNDRNVLAPISVGSRKNRMSISRSYKEFLDRELHPLSIYENPLFIGSENDLTRKYHMRSENPHTFRFLVEVVPQKDDEKYIVNVHNHSDFITGIVSEDIKDIEWIQFKSWISTEMPRYSEIRYTKEEMSYIPIADLPLALCSMPYVGEKRIIIKFRQTPAKIGKIYLYCQNHTERDQIILMPLYIAKDRIVISNGSIGILPK